MCGFQDREAVRGTMYVWKKADSYLKVVTLSSVLSLIRTLLHMNDPLLTHCECGMLWRSVSTSSTTTNTWTGGQDALTENMIHYGCCCCPVRLHYRADDIFATNCALWHTEDSVVCSCASKLVSFNPKPIFCCFENDPPSPVPGSGGILIHKFNRTGNYMGQIACVKGAALIALLWGMQRHPILIKTPSIMNGKYVFSHAV